MKVRIFLLVMLLALVFTMAANAQGKQPRHVKYTSVYTGLGRTCKVLRGSNGSDDAYLCRGVGGYRVRVYSSAAATHIAAEINGTDETFPLATVSVGFDESKTRLEWRLANGKPFAVIMRVPQYGPITDDDPYFGEAVGQELTIQGLKGFGDLNASVGAKTAGANAKARALADKAYAQGR